MFWVAANTVVRTMTPFSAVLAACCLCKTSIETAKLCNVLHQALHSTAAMLAWFMSTSNVSGLMGIVGRMLLGEETSRNLSACEAKCDW